MTTVTHKGTRWTLHALTLHWEELDAEITRLAEMQGSMCDCLRMATAQGFKADYSAVDKVGRRINEFLAELADVEIILVENEADGWTST